MAKIKFAFQCQLYLPGFKCSLGCEFHTWMLILAELKQVRELRGLKFTYLKVECSRGREVAKRRCLFLDLGAAMELGITDTNDR